ncbi:MAG TPA: hypothetical protein DEF07_01315 [Nitrosomonas sp.]|uniref:hypothetical protein n=1 Tax=Nitrosomonas sp. TaxID=42353 RepID=UPI000E995FBC|nr:hypothetical protein [Nitrosomonas sp.]GJL74209.1 MAG: hypothetical protein NMNS02_03150 [Nitrosomonas sp.]HBV20343.1 hypothetical protein [Nitrosomonas sp.]
MKYIQTLIVVCMLLLLIAGNTAVAANDYINHDTQRIGMATSQNRISASGNELKRSNVKSESQESCVSHDMDELDSSGRLKSGNKKYDPSQAC